MKTSFLSSLRATPATALATALTAAALTAAALPAHAAGAVAVNFVQPEFFADAGRVGFDRERTMRRLTDELQQLGTRLPEGQALTVEVLDIDLAGHLEPGRGGTELRVLRGRADWPRIHLRYTLVADGQPLRSGDEWLADMTYLDQRGRIPQTQDLAFERRMLAEWFNRAIAGPAPATP
jgi:Protein of unknown function (DUF3016)